jgi:hypothetical protein
MQIIRAGLSMLFLVATIAGARAATPVHDGAHDFDFLIGDWKAHLHRRIDPKTGLTASGPGIGVWVDYDGTCKDKKLLDTSANFEDFDVTDPKTHARYKGQALRMYNPAARQWSIYGLDLDNGGLGLPPLVGGFTGKRGEFYDQEMRGGQLVLVRYVWSDLSPKAARMVQSFSHDGGKTWDDNWICDLSR